MSDFNNSEVKLRVENIEKVFGGKRVLKNISFDVMAGEFLSLLGPSGCGKSTTLRILMGLETPDSGHVFMGDRDITYAAPNDRNMGIVFQDYALFENMSVRQNVEYALRFHKEYADNRRSIAEGVLTELGLGQFLDHSVQSLSGGQRQRVSIARTLALNPDVILFDEPMSALDVETRLSLRALLKDIQKEYGTTMIYITHDQEEAFALSDRIMVLGSGEIHQLASPEEIIKNPADDYVNEFVIRNIKIKLDSLIKYMG